MTGPSWVPGTFAGIMLVVAVVSAARLAVTGAATGAGRRWLAADADADAAHLLMAVAMAGMLAASLKTLPAGVWEPVFGVLTAWFAVRVARQAGGDGPRGWIGNCHAPHLVHSAAMLYMFLALRTATGGGAGMSGAAGRVLALPTLALVLALALAGYAVRDLDKLTAPAAGWLAQPARVESGASAVAGGAATVSFASTPGWPPFRKVNLSGRPTASAGGETATRAVAWLPICCRIAMGVTMAYMLIVMI
jgi:Domain of unknown function (DUF5134)